MPVGQLDIALGVDHVDLDLLELQRVSLEAKLNTLRDRPPQESIPRLDIPTLPGPTIDLEELYTLGEENRQELRAVEALMEKYERAIDLSEKSPWPDITLGTALTGPWKVLIPVLSMSSRR